MLVITRAGCWYTYPLKNMSSSIGMIFPFPTEWKVIKVMFQSPPTREATIFSNLDPLAGLNGQASACRLACTDNSGRRSCGVFMQGTIQWKSMGFCDDVGF